MPMHVLNSKRVSRYHHIDVLRGCAILAVLLLHVGIMTEGLDFHPNLTLVVQRLSIGIQLFFVLSGYLVSISLDRCMVSGEGIRGFLIRRAAKIVPLYLLFLHLNIIIFLVSSALSPGVVPFRNSVTADNLTWGNYLLHLGFLQGFTPVNLHTLLDGSWSILIEVYFYLLFPFALARACRSAIGCARVYVLSLGVAIAFILLIGRHFSGFSHYGFPAQLPCFLLGALAHRISQMPNFESHFAPWRKVAIACSVMLMIGLVKGESKPLGDSNVYALCFTAILLASSVLTEVLAPTIVAGLAALGRQSYALFFVHLALLKGTYLYLSTEQIVLPFWPSLALNLIVAVPLTWLVSAFVFDRIDRYFVALADRSLNRSQLDKNLIRTQA